jgi:DnaJ-domain-containing protein 1
MTGPAEVHRFLEVLAAHPVLPPNEELPPKDEAFRALLADLARGENSSHAEILRAVSTATRVSTEELTRRVRFVLACFFLPASGNHYEVLGLPRDASAREIRQRWATLIQRHHPDRLGGTGWLDDQARRLIQAYQTLKDSTRRREYDATLALGAEQTLGPLKSRRAIHQPSATRSVYARWAPLMLAAVGIAAVVWAALRPAPAPLPPSPLLPAVRSVDPALRAREPQRPPAVPAAP